MEESSLKPFLSNRLHRGIDAYRRDEDKRTRHLSLTIAQLVALKQINSSKNRAICEFSQFFAQECVNTTMARLRYCAACLDGTRSAAQHAQNCARYSAKDGSSAAFDCDSHALKQCGSSIVKRWGI